MAIDQSQKEDIMKKYYDWQSLRCYMTELVRLMQLDSFKPDVVIGPGRGGYIPGVMLSHYFEIPFEGFLWQTRDGFVEDSASLENILSKYHNQQILIVDDINDTGTTLLGISQIVERNRLNSQVKYATMFSKQSSQFDVDYTAEEIELENDNWLVFPYEEWWKYE